MKLKAIGAATQIEDCILGASAEDTASLNMKIEFTKKHIDDVILINGKKPYAPIVIGNDIFYFLSEIPEWFKITDKTARKYYYPIQYAEITFFDTAHP